MGKGFTQEEAEIVDLIDQLNAKFHDLPPIHPSVKVQWNGGIHILQSILGTRLLQRDYPDIFPTYKD